MDIALIKQRRHFDELLQIHPELRFMRGGRAGRIPFDVIQSKNEGYRDTIQFKSLERAPIIDIRKRQFRRSFPLSVDYTLLESTELFGNSPKEELELFANSHLINENPINAVVSLLNPRYSGTAFHVSPKGLITCSQNLTLECGGSHEELWIHREVASSSYGFATNRERVTVVPPILQKMEEGLKYQHEDIAFLRSLPGKTFLIPYAGDMVVGDAIICIGYPREVDSRLINRAYNEINPALIPDFEEYAKLFTSGILSISPGPLQGYNSSKLVCSVAMTPGCSGSPVCLLHNPRLFIGIHSSAQERNDSSTSISVKDDGFYQLYSNFVVPELRDSADICDEDIDAINRYLSIGTTPLLIKTKPLTNVNCDDASLDDEDDERFFMAVLSIAITEEDDFELCRLFCEMLNELCGGVSFNVIFAANPTLFEEVINVFIAADVSGGSYNNRACKFVCN